jgi:zinc protease
VTEAEVRTLAAETYGKVARRAEPPPRDWPTEPPSLTSRTVVLHDERVTQPGVSINLLTPSYTQGDRRAGLALDLLADILGGGSTSRIYRSIVLGQSVAVGAIAVYSGSWIGDGRFVVAASPKAGHTLDEVLVALEAVMADARDKGVTAEELAIAKERVLAAAILAQDGPANMAQLFGSGLAIGRTLEEIKTYPSLIQTITLDEVNAAARAYLDVRGAVIGRLEGPASAGGKQ